MPSKAPRHLGALCSQPQLSGVAAKKAGLALLCFLGAGGLMAQVGLKKKKKKQKKKSDSWSWKQNLHLST